MRQRQIRFWTEALSQLVEAGLAEYAFWRDEIAWRKAGRLKKGMKVKYIGHTDICHLPCSDKNVPQAGVDIWAKRLGMEGQIWMGTPVEGRVGVRLAQEKALVMVTSTHLLVVA